MSTPSTGAAAPCFFQPACLPQVLMQYAEALATASAGNNDARQSAALAIIQEYYSFFGATGMRQDMWHLLTGALCGNNTESLVHSHNLLFFYEFTLLLFDAVYALHGGDRFGTMSLP